VIFTGSREYGTERPGVSQAMLEREAKVAASAISKLVAVHVMGLTDDPHKRDRTAKPGDGLVIVQGGADGLDDLAARIARIVATGLRRRGRDQFRKIFVEPHLADGLWLETYPADWNNRPRHLAGPERNQLMLDKGADHVIAFFSAGKVYGPDERGGTNDMVRRAHRAGVPVDIYEADARAWRKP
jgi:hypothetical protein